nr:hypothetical protein [Tanacetum cinerariifolium]
MTGNRSQLINFVSKFVGTVRFKNNQVAKIMGFGDYQQGNVIISKRLKDEAPDAIIKCIKNIYVHLNATVRNVRTDNGTEFVIRLSVIFMKMSVFRIRFLLLALTLMEAARTMLIFSKAHLFLWAEVINTTCYTQNCSLIRLRYNKIPYELMHDKKPDLSIFHVFGSLCYPTNDIEDLVPIAAAPRVVDIADSSVSTSIDQDKPSTSIPSPQEQEQSLIISQGVEESPKTPHFNDGPLHGTLHEDSTSQGSSSNVRPSHTPFELLVEAKNYKEAMLEPFWIDAMQEEIHKFERVIINPQETQQVVARDEKYVPSAKIVKISSTNIRLETKIKQKEETFQIPPKKRRGKCSKGKKTAKESQGTVNVSKKSEPKPKQAKKKTSSKRRVKKKVTLSADDNIISDDPDAALELAKSISQTEAEAERKVHATHARIVAEYVPKSTKKKSSGRSSKGVVI